MNKLITLLLFFLFTLPVLQAQDKIILQKKKKKIDATILEIGNNYVKYRLTGQPDGPVYSVNPIQIRRIEFADGSSTELMRINPRVKNPFGFNLGLSYMLDAEWPMISLNLEYFTIPQIAIVAETGTDTEDGFYFLTGVKYHINRNYTKSGFTPFIGLLAGSLISNASVQVPFGINYMAPFGLNTSLSVNELFLLNTEFAGTSLELKLGWHF
jgi:hypothetical protein